jgi:hypothetical protein
MPFVLPVFFVDTDGNQWKIAVNSNEQIELINVFDVPGAVASLNMNSVTDGTSFSISILPSGEEYVQQIAQGVYPTQMLVSSPNGTLYAIQLATVLPPTLATPAEGMLQVAFPAAPVEGFPPFNTDGNPSWKVISLAAPDRYIGAVASAVISCQPGDVFILTSTVRWLSGGMRPRMSLQFRDLTGTIFYGSIQFSPPNTDSGWHIMTVSGVAPAGSAIAQVVTDCEYLAPDTQSYMGPTSGAPSSLGSPSLTAWEVSDYRILQNGQPVYSPLDTLSPFLTAFAFIREFIFPLYYMSLLTSEYQQAANLWSWLGTLMGLTTDLLSFIQQAYQSFDVDSALGPQLDILGSIVGVSRVLPFQPSTGGVSATLLNDVFPGPSTALVNNTINMFIGNPITVSAILEGGGVHDSETVTITAINPGVSFNAVFANHHYTGELAYSSGVNLDSTLSDSDYLTLILAKIARNQWNGQIDSLYSLWNQLFPDGHIIFIDNQNMTATIVLAGLFTAIQQAMIVNDLIVPRPQAVLYNFVFGDLPLLGFDLDNAIIAGFDTGHFA